MSQPPEEEKAHGRITMKTYYKYFTTERGHLFTLLMVVTFILAEVRVVHQYYVRGSNTCIFITLCAVCGYAVVAFFCVCVTKTVFLYMPVKYLSHSSTLYVTMQRCLLDLLSHTYSAIPKVSIHAVISPGFPGETSNRLALSGIITCDVQEDQTCNSTHRIMCSIELQFLACFSCFLQGFIVCDDWWLSNW